MKSFRADLHCHTTYSDGSMAPDELLSLAKQSDLQGLSITDHDTTDAYAEALPLAKNLDIKLMSGTELSCSIEKHSVHVLAYAFDLSNAEFQSKLTELREWRTDRNRMILTKLASLGMKITEEELLSYVSEMGYKGSIGRPHIAWVMAKRGFVSGLQDAFNRYIGDDRPCYAAGHKLSVSDGIELIHKAGGLACLAHPHVIRNTKMIEHILSLNFDGIEGYYSRFSPDKEQPWIDIGKEKGWFVTGGSDFHGTPKPNITLGMSWTCKETFEKLYQRFLDQNRGLL